VIQLEEQWVADWTAYAKAQERDSDRFWLACLNVIAAADASVGHPLLPTASSRLFAAVRELRRQGYGGGA
jgi:hypothetical protein